MWTLPRIATRCALALAAAILGVRALAGQCYQVTDEDEACSTCPGISVCQCLYIGAACPSQDISCSLRKKVIVAGNLNIATQSETCTISRQCVSNLGGPCDPLNNVCKKVGIAIINPGIVYDQLPETCMITLAP